MEGPNNLFEVYEMFESEIRLLFPKNADRILNELRTALLHHLLPSFGYIRTSSSRKMSAREVEAAFIFLKTLPTN